MIRASGRIAAGRLLWAIAAFVAASHVATVARAEPAALEPELLAQQHTPSKISQIPDPKVQPSPDITWAAGLPLRRDPPSDATGPDTLSFLLGLVTLALTLLYLFFKQRRSQRLKGSDGGAANAARAWWRRPLLGRGPFGGRLARELTLVETLQLPPHTRVCVVRWDDKEYLVGFGNETMTLLDSRAASSERERLEPPKVATDGR